MKRTPVDSTDLVSVGYDPVERILEVEFKGNRVYQYLEVPRDIAEGLLKAASYGQYFYAHITAYYRYRRVE